ncbi:unnamed protein product [Adineta ricciae]|uniref:Toll-interacting protein n=1 Tax=Adineta ricciae TaxID=249248 RepID=A0A813WDN9_ADIRI|nr:unnamed protein product [Adineta ricciae]
MASAAASSNYNASAGAASYATTNPSNDDRGPKFNEYRSRVMLGDLPQDFLRIQLVQAQIFDPMGHGMRQQGYGSAPHPQQLQQNPNFLGYFTLTIAEAKLIKSAGLLGLIKMDPYVSFRIGHVSYDTQTASGGGKNPQWKASYRINLFKGMDKIHLIVYDQRNFTEDSFIGECEVTIPREVIEGETRQQWYQLMGRQANANEIQGDILIIMSFMPVRSSHPTTPANGATSTPAGNATGSTQPAPHATEQSAAQHSPSVTPKPPPLPYSEDDIRTVKEMFPNVDEHFISELLKQHGGNKDLVVNHLLQNAV